MTKSDLIVTCLLEKPGLSCESFKPYFAFSRTLQTFYGSIMQSNKIPRGAKLLSYMLKQHQFELGRLRRSHLGIMKQNDPKASHSSEGT